MSASSSTDTRSAYVKVSGDQEEGPARCSLDDRILQTPSRPRRPWQQRRGAAAAACFAAVLAASAALWELSGSRRGRKGASQSLGKLQVKVERRHGHGGDRSSKDERGCHTAVLGESCFDGVMWAMDTGILQQPTWYPNLTTASTFEDFQALLHSEKKHSCPAPCRESKSQQEFVVSGDKDGEAAGSRRSGSSARPPAPVEAAPLPVQTTTSQASPTGAPPYSHSLIREGSCWAVEDDFDYPGGTLRTLTRVLSVSECCKRCKAEKECRQWTHDPTRGSCELKRQLRVGRTPCEGVASGLPGHDVTQYQIKSEHRTCVDANPRGLRAARCHKHDELQLWIYDRGTGEIYAKHGSCLHVAKSGPGGAVEARPCSPHRNDLRQQWEYDSSVRLLRSYHGHCLTATRLGEDAPLSLAVCDESREDQRWSIVEPGAPKETPKGAGGSGPGKSSGGNAGKPLFEIIKKGTCAEAGMTPITTRVTCELAARMLDMVDTGVTPTAQVDRPEGCYMFEMDMLWMGINPASKGRGWQPYREPICMRPAPQFDSDVYVEQKGAGIPVGGEVKIYGVGSSNLVWMAWIDQMHLYLERLGYKLPLVEPKAILSRVTPRSVPSCDDSAYYAKSKTARLGMVGWNSWDFAYSNWNDCDAESFRNISGHKVKCGVGPGCKGGKFLISASSIAEDAAKSNVTIVSTWYNDHKAFLTHYDCFDGEKLEYEKTAEVTVPSIMRTIKEIHKRNPYVAILVMGLYPPTLDYKVVEAEVPWIKRLNSAVRETVEKEPNTFFVDYDLPGGGLEMYDRVHYGHPNCRGAKIMVYAAIQRLYKAKVLTRGIREVDPKANLANPDCGSLADAAVCGTSSLCWVDPADGKCKSYSIGHRAFNMKKNGRGSRL